MHSKCDLDFLKTNTKYSGFKMKIRNCGFVKLILTKVLLVSSLVVAGEMPLSATHTRFVSKNIDQVDLGPFSATADVVKDSQSRAQSAFDLTSALRLSSGVQTSRCNPVVAIGFDQGRTILYAA